MRTRTFLIRLTQCALCVFLICSPKGGGAQEDSSREKEGKKDEFPVTMDIAAGMPDGDGKLKITVTLTIRIGYYVFANPPGNEYADDLKPILRVAGKNVAKDVLITYPKGEVVKDEIIGDYRVYKGAVKLEAVVQRPRQDAESLTVSVRLRPFDHRGCRWRTTTLEKRVP
jgi:hypothetical protein